MTWTKPRTWRVGGKPTVQEALTEALHAASYACNDGNPEPLQKLLDGMTEILWDEDRLRRLGPHADRIAAELVAESRALANGNGRPNAEASDAAS